MNDRLRRWLGSRRRIALVAAVALVAGGMTTVTATAAFAAVSCQVTYQKNWEGGNGFGGTFTINNLAGSDNLTSWTLRFSFTGTQNQQVSNGWNGVWTQSGQNVTVTNAPYNGNLPAGGSIQGVGFNGTFTTPGPAADPVNFTLNGVACTGSPQPTPQLVVSSTNVSVPEGSTASYSVRLSSAPSANVTVASTAAATGDTNITVSSGGSLTFTPSNWSTNQTVTLAASEDTDTVNGSRTINVTSTTAGINPVAVAATEADNDPTQTQSLVVTPTALTVNEGGTGTFTVRLNILPTANTTVSIAAGTGDTSLTATPTSLTFTPTNGTTAQTVTVSAAEDGDSTNGTRPFTVSSSGLASVTVNATEVDNDPTTQALVVSATAVSVPENGTATYTVRLQTAPSANVTVNNTAGSGDTSITVTSGGTLTFTPANFATPQTVTLAAAEDTDTTNGARTINVSSSGLTTVPVTATEADNDPGTATLVVTPTAVAVTEGSSTTYSVRLSAVPSGNVTVTSTAATGGTNDADLTVSAGGSLTFTTATWNVAQNVTVAAAEDADQTNGSRTINVAATGYPTVAVTATEADNDPTGGNTYLQEFMIQYNKLKDPANGYFSPEGVPYHSVETLMVEAPDHGHETTSEAYSFYVWLEAMYGRETGDWTRFNNAWTNLETFIIPSSGFVTGGYNATDPADYAPEFNQPSQYPAPLDANIDTGNDPLYQELVSTYGNASIYGMHWLLDVDNIYGYGQAVSSTANCRDNTVRVVYINTYQRGPQESVWETVPHPSCETFAWGQQNNGGFAPIFIGGTAAQQWRFTNAPDADARAIEAAYWAHVWATERGQASAVSSTVQKAAKMGDYLRYAFYDKYFKAPNCQSPSCPTSSGKAGSTGLLSWYYAWGGAMDNAWSWRIGSSHNHGGYQNPLAAWAMSPAGPTAIRPQSPTAAADWAFSLTRQIQFITWLQSAEGAIAGGATNSWNGNYSAFPAGQPTFFGMVYDVDPVYHDPPSNQWFGFQAWGMSRVAEYYNVTGDAAAKAILDKWITWAVGQTTLGTGNAFQIPSEMSWTGAPSASFSSASGMPGANPNLHVTVTSRGTDVGVAAAFARTLIAYAARAGETTTIGAQAKSTAKGLLDRLLMRKDTRGVAIPEQRSDYNRFDDVWSSSNQQGLFIPSGYSGVTPTGATIQPGSTFQSIRPFYASDTTQTSTGGSLWAAIQAYQSGSGPAPTVTYHRFWAQADLALALADYGHFFPNG